MIELASLVSALLGTYDGIAQLVSALSRGPRVDSAEGLVGRFPNPQEEADTDTTLLLVEKMERAAQLSPP